MTEPNGNGGNGDDGTEDVAGSEPDTTPIEEGDDTSDVAESAPEMRSIGLSQDRHESKKDED